jgi:hypothetical protein
MIIAYAWIDRSPHHDHRNSNDLERLQLAKICFNTVLEYVEYHGTTGILISVIRNAMVVISISPGLAPGCN